MGYVTLLGAGGPQYDPATLQWLAQLSSGPSQATINAVNTFIKQCKVDTTWALLDRAWLFGQDIQANAKVSLVNPASTQITEVNSPTWTANKGYTFDGATTYLNSNFTPSTNGVNFLQDTNSFGIYSRTNSAINGVDMGGSSAGPIRCLVFPKFTDNSYYVKDNADTYLTSPATDSLALAHINRDSSTHLSYNLRGAFVGAANVNTTGNLAASFFIGAAQNIGGAPGSFSSRQISFAFTGGSFSGTQLTAFYNAVQTLGTTLTWNV